MSHRTLSQNTLTTMREHPGNTQRTFTVDKESLDLKVLPIVINSKVRRAFDCSGDKKLNYFNCWVSEMISLKMFTFWIFSTLTGSFEVVVINNNLSTTNKWHLFTFPLMFIFSPEVLEILGKCRWNMGNYHHRNWIGKSSQNDPHWQKFDHLQVEPSLPQSALRSSKKGLVVPHWPVVRWVGRWWSSGSSGGRDCG